MEIKRVEEFCSGGAKILFDAHPSSRLMGAMLLRDVEKFIARFVVLPRAALAPLAVWILATHCFETFDVFPYLGITSPVPRCGKSTVLDLIGLLSRTAIPASNISEAALFRTISEEHPVLLLDEAEWLREKSERAQIIRNLLNAGHRSNAYTIRCEKDGKRSCFCVFCPKAIAAIGELSDTLADRSISISMQRRAESERSGRFRFARVKVEAGPLREEISRYMAATKSMIAAAYESLPDLTFLDERAADNWSPLFAVLSVADPERVDEFKGCAQALSSARADGGNESLALRLLMDLSAVAESRTERVIRTEDLIAGAREQPENPWIGEIELTARKVAKWLRGFEIRPVRTELFRGYDRLTILDAARRYSARQASGASEASAASAEKT